MNLTDSVAILIARPDALPRRMANRDMFALCPRQMMVGAPFVGVDGGSILGGVQDTGLKIPFCAFFLKSIGPGRFHGRRSPAREDGRSPTYHGPEPYWHGGAVGPRGLGVRCLSRPHLGTSHPLPRPRQVKGLDYKPVPRAPEFCGDAQANAYGQYPIPSPDAGSVSLGQSPARCAQSHNSDDGCLARAFQQTRCRSDRRNNETTTPAFYPAYVASTARPESCTLGNIDHPDAESRPENRNISAHPSIRLLRNGSSVPPLATYYGVPIL